ncbi:hypothetical protein [Bacillus sp. AFS031507]|uniref:hypothetical protein n=1 Tax=Bacillus sp. AFS031507 TaxID=2033496 RepID=UPI000BFD627C|nr:hypothetical protein [Bacillus sp. AFS031507]PGY13189.1 hypothetical protein COE25_08515 [Bacillus sp. AFS031507]
MAKHYLPLCLTNKNLTANEIYDRKVYEESCIKKAINLAEKSKDQDVQYFIFKFQFWHEWTEDHFPLIKEYVKALYELDKILGEMVLYPKAYQDPDYKKLVRSAENDIKLIEKGLKITGAIREITEKYEEALDNE